jgi:NAD(P)-dependent dehydrogenase (short-subunit alcohol dehydrogenase family)
MTTPIAILFGAGARVGAATTTTFLQAGYRLARVSRSQNPNEDSDMLLNIPAELSVPENVEKVFATVRSKWGEPSVVIYNGAQSHLLRRQM